MASTSTAKTWSAMKKYPNWLEMPDELMANILERLGTKEILERAWKVCTTWRRICKNPMMWKVIVLRKEFGDWGRDSHFERLTKQAIDLSCGELTGLSIKGFGTDELLHNHIVLRSCKLKQLYLIRCYNITGSGLIRAVKKVPQLEELGICDIFINKEDIKVIGQNCPQLKSFTVVGGLTRSFIDCDDNAFAIANNMPELRRLKLFDKNMTNIGLKAILDGCPHLESLDIRMFYDLDGYLRKLCMERIKDFKFHFEVEEDDFYDYPSPNDLEGDFDYTYSA